MLNVAMLGASGRMGRAIVPLIVEAGDVTLTGALAAAQDPSIGHDAGVLSGVAPCGVAVTDDPAVALRGAAVSIDFTRPDASVEHARLCREAGCALVVGTTGHDAAERARLEAVTDRIPVVIAPNMSLGVNLLFRLAELAARALDTGYDIEIFEAHHRHKVDAPSGTALGLGRAAATGRGGRLEDLADYIRHGQTGARVPGRIGFSVMRGGDIVGEHRLVFAGPGEQVELSHLAQDRSSFARGAIAAARWAAGRPPGLYTMADVLGL
ncbi:MAG: 4-hydroxy-tetrahydrodipicolinate reductase [Steroidobacteraceae bacterium]